MVTTDEAAGCLVRVLGQPDHFGGFISREKRRH